MKKKTHPNYNTKCKVKCSCGNTFETGSTKDAINVEICNACHPFFTGEKKLIDNAGRVDKFKAKMAKVKEAAKKYEEIKKAKNKRSKKAKKDEDQKA